MGEKIEVEYEIHENPIRFKNCPLLRCRISDRESSECFRTDCSAVTEDRYQSLYGHRYHCAEEKRTIQEEHARYLKKAEYYKKLSNSLDIVRQIDLTEFSKLCDKLDREMIENRQEYTESMSLNLYHDEENKCLIYHFKNNEVIEISVVDNPFNYIGVRFEEIRNKEIKSALSCCSIPGYLADAINVNLHLKYKMDVKSILHNNNPVYIKAKGIAKYIDAAYGWNWLHWKRLRDQHLEMTEITNFDNIIYIKQELDEIISREYYS